MTDPSEGSAGVAGTPDVLSAAGNGRDGGLYNQWAGTADAIVQYETGYLGGAQFTGATGRHIGGANYAAADGHVKWMRPEYVSSGVTNASVTGAQDPAAGGAAAGTSNSTYRLTFSPM